MGEKVQFSAAQGIQFFRELNEGETWRPHPSGNGIIVAHPDRQPMWCRTENDTMIQDYIQPSVNGRDAQ